MSSVEGYTRKIDIDHEGAGADAFGRFRISPPVTIFDSKQLIDSQPLFWDDQQISGSGTTTQHLSNESTTLLSVAVSMAGTRARQTFARFNYQPGKSQMVMMTGVFGSGTAGINQKIGVFASANGLFFHLSGTTLSVVKRSKASGNIVDTEVPQSEWNIDKLGAGALNPSGETLDISKAQVFIIDYQWLGTGRVRFGFSIGGRLVYVHQMNHANIIDTVYMQTPNLPLRYEISNDGTGAATHLRHICSTVISEGGRQDVGITRVLSTSGVALSANVSGTLYLGIGIRLQASLVDAAAIIAPKYLTLLATTNDDFEWSVIYNGSWAGSVTWTPVSNSAVEYALGRASNTVTSGVNIAGGVVAAGQSPRFDIGEAPIRLGDDLSGSATHLLLCIRPLGQNLDVQGTFTYLELL